MKKENLKLHRETLRLLTRPAEGLAERLDEARLRQVAGGATRISCPATCINC